RLQRLKQRLFVLIALSVGATVAFTGIISFVGLVVPQLLRLWLGPDHRGLLPGSILLGAALLLAADLLARTLLAPAEMPIGIITALVGAPFFIALLLQSKKRQG
ncbi:MAG: iron chelate uptake ABC transporter family permease subunit, partial [Sphingobacteriia bacterium]